MKHTYHVIACIKQHFTAIWPKWVLKCFYFVLFSFLNRAILWKYSKKVHYTLFTKLVLAGNRLNTVQHLFWLKCTLYTKPVFTKAFWCTALYTQFNVYRAKCVVNSMYTEQHVCSIECIQSNICGQFNVYRATCVLNSMYTEQHVCSIQCIQGNMCAQFNIYRATCVLNSMYTDQHVCSIQCIQSSMCAQSNVT